MDCLQVHTGGGKGCDNQKAILMIVLYKFY